MKKLSIALGILLLAGSILAQAPQSFKYQAIARDAEGTILSNQNINLRISIVSDNVTSVAVYTETHNLLTSPFGLINLEIGNGENKSGDFSTIDWSKGKYYVNIEIDENGGNDFVNMGSSQLLSVPYALYAEKSGSQSESASTSLSTGSKEANSWTEGTGVTYLTNPNNVGIGTIIPVSKLHVTGSGINAVYERNISTAAGPANRFYKSRGTASSKTQIQAGDNMGQFQFWGMGSDGAYDIGATLKGVAESTRTGTDIFDVAASIQFLTTNTAFSWGERMRITADGYVGIGTSAPAGILDIAGQYHFPSTDGSYGQILETNGSGTLNWVNKTSASPGGATGYVQYNNAGSFAGESSFYWDANANRLGIGTSSPSFTLDVNGSVGFKDYIYHNADANTFYWFSNDRFSFYAGGISMINCTEDAQDIIAFGNHSDIDIDFNGKAFINGLTGRFGIGYNTPSFMLDIFSNGPDGIRTKTDDDSWLVIDKGATADNSFVALRTAGSDQWIVGSWGSNDDFMIKNWGMGGSSDNTFFIDDASSAIGLNTNSPYTTDLLSMYPGDDYTYGLYNYQNRTASGTLYGIDAVINNTYDGAASLYGVYGSLTKSGTDGSTKYAVRGYVTDKETGSTRYNYGVYGYSYVNSSDGSSYAYGVRGSVGGSPDYEYGVYYSGGLGGSGTKSAIVRTDNGPKEVYCVEAPGNWFEDFGEATVKGGKAIVKLSADYLQTVTINSKYHMKVFITPNADLKNWWIEKGETSFTLYAPNAIDGSGFDYRVVAKRRGYEDIRLREAPAAYTDHYLYPDIKDVPSEHRAEWVRQIDPDHRDPAWMSYLKDEEVKLLREEVHPKRDKEQQNIVSDVKSSTE